MYTESRPQSDNHCITVISFAGFVLIETLNGCVASRITISSYMNGPLLLPADSPACSMARLIFVSWQLTKYTTQHVNLTHETCAHLCSR